MPEDAGCTEARKVLARHLCGFNEDSVVFKNFFPNRRCKSGLGGEKRDDREGQAMGLRLRLVLRDILGG